MEVGMNDHVGKPFSLDELVHTVLRWTQGESAANAAAAPPDQPTANVPLPAWFAEVSADATRLDAAGAIQRLGGDPSFYARVLRGFMDTLPGLQADLHQQADGGHLAALAATLHTLKGSAATAGLQALSTGAAQAEQAVKAATEQPDGLQQGATETWRGHWAALQVEWPQSLVVAGAALERLQTHLQAAEPLAAADVPRTEWLNSLRQMVALLVASDMDVLDRYDAVAIAPSFQAEPGLAAFRGAMDGMDFETALDELQEWLRNQPQPTQTMAAL
jgi:two-component system, sensor histidine kinase and response regulator